MVNDDKKRSHGGARPGAGRPRADEGMRFGFYLSADVAERLKKVSARDGMTPYSWCKKIVLEALTNEAE